MSERIKVVSAWVFGVLVALALTFGARSALAQPVSTDCPYNPPEELGACSSDPECQTMCEAVNPPGVTGNCVGNECCICLL